MVNGHAPVSHKVKHQDELRGITAKLINIEKLEVRGGVAPETHAGWCNGVRPLAFFFFVIGV